MPLSTRSPLESPNFFDSAWCKEYTWLQVVRDDGGKTQGMICRLCRDYGRQPRSGSGVWSKVMCTSFRKDKLDLHAKSSMHKAARIVCVERQQSVATGGIPQAFHDVLTAERMAVIGCCKLALQT